MNFRLSSNGRILLSGLFFHCVILSVFNICGVHKTHDNCCYVYYI
jgi:hypothetical protein